LKLEQGGASKAGLLSNRPLLAAAHDAHDASTNNTVQTDAERKGKKRPLTSSKEQQAKVQGGS